MMKRLIKIVLLFIVSIIILLALLVSTESGTRIIFAAAKQVVPGELNVGKLQGRLIENVTIINLNYENKNIALQIKQLSLSWKPLPIFFAKLKLTQIEADGIILQLLKEMSDEKQVTNRKKIILPLEISLHATHLTNVKIDIPQMKAPISINQIDGDIKLGRDKIKIKKLIIQEQNANADISGDIGWNIPYNATLAANISYTINTAATLQGSLHFAGDIHNYQLSAKINEPFSLILTGHANAASKHFKLSGQWQKFHWPFIDNTIIDSPSGQFEMAGTIDDYTLTLQAKLQGKKIPAQDITLSGTGNSKKLAVNTLNIDTLSGTINGQGHLYWAPRLEWQALLQGEKLDLSEHWPVLPGLIDFSLASKGYYEENNTHLHLQIPELSGHINQQPLSGQMRFDIYNDSFNIQKTILTVGKNHLKINGGFDRQWALNWDAHIHDLSQLLAESNGMISSQGTISGPTQHADIAGAIAADQFNWRQFYIGKLVGNTDLDPELQENSVLQLDFSDISYKNLNINKLIINAEGTLDKHQLNGQLSSHENQLNFNINANYTQNQWVGSWETFFIKTAADERWQLQQAATLTLAKDNRSLTPLCLNADLQKICLQAHWQPQQASQAHLQIERFNLQPLSSLLSDNIQLRTQLDLDMQLNINDEQQLSGQLTVRVDPGILQVASPTGTQHFSFRQAILDAAINEEGAQAKMAITIDDNNWGEAQATLPDYVFLRRTLADQEIQAKAQINLSDLAHLSVFIPKADSVAGKLNFELTMSGKVNNPNVNSDLKLEQAQISSTELGINIHDINLHGYSITNNAFKVDGAASSGEGNITGSAAAKLEATKFSVQATIHGENFEVINTEEYQASITPDLNFNSINNRINIDGRILIPHARITPLDFRRSISLPNDVVFIAQAKQSKRRPFIIRTNVIIRLGDDITLDFMGLTGGLRGRVAMIIEPDQAPIANGSLNITDGQFTFMGQTLEITYGQLFYSNSPINNPGINARASRTISGQINLTPSGSRLNIFTPANPFTTFQPSSAFEEFKVGVDITGQAREPEIKLFSEPSTIPQGDILSYLVLGQSLAQVSEDQSGLLLQALNTLNVGSTGESQIISQLQNTLGLEQISFESQRYYDPSIGQVTSSTALVLGKSLSPRIFVSSSVRLREQRYILRLNYILADHWLLQSATDGQDTGLDLVYTFERE